MYASSGQEQKMAQEVLTTLKEHPDAWQKVRIKFLSYDSISVNIHLGGHNLGVFPKSTDQIFCPSNPRVSDQNQMEGSTPDPV